MYDSNRRILRRNFKNLPFNAIIAISEIYLYMPELEIFREKDIQKCFVFGFIGLGKKKELCLITLRGVVYVFFLHYGGIKSFQVEKRCSLLAQQLLSSQTLINYVSIRKALFIFLPIFSSASQLSQTCGLLFTECFRFPTTNIRYI